MLNKEEIQKLGAQELASELEKTQKEYMKLRLQHASTELKDTHKLKASRRYIARLKTLKR